MVFAFANIIVNPGSQNTQVIKELFLPYIWMHPVTPWVLYTILFSQSFRKLLIKTKLEIILYILLDVIQIQRWFLFQLLHWAPTTSPFWGSWCLLFHSICAHHLLLDANNAGGDCIVSGQELIECSRGSCVLQSHIVLSLKLCCHWRLWKHFVAMGNAFLHLLENVSTLDVTLSIKKGSN